MHLPEAPPRRTLALPAIAFLALTLAAPGAPVSHAQDQTPRPNSPSSRPMPALLPPQWKDPRIAPSPYAKPADDSGPTLAELHTPNALLPDAPGSLLEPQAAPAQQAGSASIAGIVLDVSEAAIVGAHVTLVDANGHDERVVLSDGKGEFLFDNLGHGPFRISVTSAGLEPFVSPEITLSPKQTYEVPHFTLPIATATTEVQVTLTIAEIATEQIKAQESQRAFGIVPNFYTSYIYNAAPMNPNQKFSLAAHSVFDPVEFLGAAAVAGVWQVTATYPGYGVGFSGYAKRYAANYGDAMIGRFLGSAILPSLLHQDPRYFYQGSGTIKSRALHAIVSAVVTRTDSGHFQPNYSYVLGDLGSGAISNLYYPHADRGTGLLFQHTAIGIGAHAFQNLIREFVLKAVTTNVPVTSNGKQ